ncbi:MOSC domain-containing protein [Sphaerisporangium aureirubrum]|uniref:MOSC domain-containing protein n=1 Tax=Sphaerisporangium aureirubrum TaxID=1544736 RepID=A0ABW1NF72_9ACTN
MGELISVNLAVPRPNPAKADVGTTGIDKRPTTEAVHVRAPGPRRTGLGSGLLGDQIFDTTSHGGDDQAVYAYAREDLDHWEGELGRSLTGGMFGENITTRGLDVNGALIGERWRIGDHLLLEVSAPRIPCDTFAQWIEEPGWIKRFVVAARPGAYLRVIEPGEMRAGDPVVVEYRPGHEVTVAVTFRATTLEPDLLPLLPPVEALPRSVRERAARRTGTTI